MAEQKQKISDAFILNYNLVEPEDEAGRFYKERQTSLSKALASKTNLPSPQNVKSIVNSKSLQRGINVPKPLVKVAPYWNLVKGLKEIDVPPVVIKKCKDHKKEREEMLKVLRERMNTQIAENFSHIKAKAMRKSQGQMLMTDRSNRGSSKLNTKTTSQKKTLQAESSNKANPTDTNLKKIQEELEKEGKFGLIETDIYILKNVLEVLPKEHFSQTLADQSGKQIDAMLFSYIKKKPGLRKNHSAINLTKQTNLTKYNAPEQSQMLRQYFQQRTQTANTSLKSASSRQRQQSFKTNRKQSFLMGDVFGKLPLFEKLSQSKTVNQGLFGSSRTLSRDFSVDICDTSAIRKQAKQLQASFKEEVSQAKDRCTVKSFLITQ